MVPVAILMMTACVGVWLVLVSTVNLGVSAACTNGGTYTTSSNGTITTDNYPSFYPKSGCTWSLTVTHGSVVLLKFSSFDVMEVGNCAFEHVTIHDGNTTGTVLGKFCGTILPPALLSTSNTMTVVLTTVGFSNTQYTGFSATFSEESPSSGLDSGCYNLASWTGTATGSIASMYFGTDAEYEDNAYCKWEITVTPGKYVNLTFHPTFVVDVFCIEADRVKVYSGVSTGLTELGSFCGYTAPSSLQSCSNEMTVEFTTDSHSGYDGFLASFAESDTGPACPAMTASMTSTAETTSAAATTSSSTTPHQVTTPVWTVSTTTTPPSTTQTTASTTPGVPSTHTATTATTTTNPSVPPSSTTQRTTTSSTQTSNAPAVYTTTTTSARATTSGVSTHVATATTTKQTPASSTVRASTATFGPVTTQPHTPSATTRVPTVQTPSATTRVPTVQTPSVTARVTTAQTASATTRVPTVQTASATASANTTATTTVTTPTTESAKAPEKPVVQLWVIGSVVGSGMVAIVTVTMTIFCCCLKKDENRVRAL